MGRTAEAKGRASSKGDAGEWPDDDSDLILVRGSKVYR